MNIVKMTAILRQPKRSFKTETPRSFAVRCGTLPWTVVGPACYVLGLMFCLKSLALMLHTAWLFKRALCDRHVVKSDRRRGSVSNLSIADLFLLMLVASLWVF
jgi:hypothetical protein